MKCFLMRSSLFLFPFSLKSHLNFWLLALLANSSPKLTTRFMTGVLRQQQFPLNYMLQQFPDKRVHMGNSLHIPLGANYVSKLQCLDLNGFLIFSSGSILSTPISVLHGFASNCFFLMQWFPLLDIHCPIFIHIQGNSSSLTKSFSITLLVTIFLAEVLTFM